MSPGGPAVLVVGAGPVGLLIACELARRGVAVRLIDRLPEPTSESRAIVVHARSLEMLERVGVLEEFLAAGNRVTSARFHSGGRSLARLPLDIVDSPHPFTLALPQTDTERILRERLAGLGVEVERGSTLDAIEQDEQGVRSRLLTAGDREETIATDWLVGADGSRSQVRSGVGARLAGSFKGERFLIADVEAEHALEHCSFHGFLHEAGILLFFPLPGERVRLIAQLGGDEVAEEPTLADAQEIAEERAAGITVRSAHWLTTFEIHRGQVPAYRYGRVFLAGDAAHIHSPAGGQGMNTGMQDAFNLGWKLALAVEGQAPAGLLDSYQAERHPVAAEVIRITQGLTRAGTLKGRLARALRSHLLRFVAGLARVQRTVAERTEETDIAYRGSPIVVERGRRGHAGPRAGETAPHVEGLPRLTELLAAGDGHTRLLIEHGRVQVDEAQLADPEGRCVKRYDVGPAGAQFVIRPDGYIGLRVEPAEEAAVSGYFAGVVGAPA